jgi:probable rRNA maturation factor
MTVTVANRQRGHKVNVTRLKQFAQAIGSDFQSLSVVLIGDAVMAQLNQRYHNTPGTTDILTFDYGAGQGELLISVDRVVAQARQFHTTPSRELALYVVHGVLHLRGYDDQTPADRRRIRGAERRWLAKLDFRGLMPIR